MISAGKRWFLSRSVRTGVHPPSISHPTAAQQVDNARFMRAPLSDRLAEDLDQRREILPIKAAGPDDGPAVAVEDEHAVEPAPVDLDQIPDVGKPDLMGSGGLFGTFVWVERALHARGSGMRLFVKRDHRPDGHIA